MKQLKYISLACALLICMVGKGQHSITALPTIKTGTWSAADISSKAPLDSNVMLKIVLRRKASYPFYREGYKRGEEYWYINGQRIKKLPVGWFVWDYRIIKK